MHLSSDDTKLNLFAHTVVGFQPTTFLYLLVLLVYQRMQFSRLEIPNDVRLNSNLFDDSWQWGMECAIGFQVCNKASVLMLFIDSAFKKYLI